MSKEAVEKSEKRDSSYKGKIDFPAFLTLYARYKKYHGIYFRKSDADKLSRDPFVYKLLANMPSCGVDD